MKWKFLLVLNFALLHLNNPQDTSKLSESACKIVSEVLNKENWMKTIAIVKFKSNFDDDVVEGLQKCLPMEISKLLIDMKSFNMSTQRIHSPSMTVMVVDGIEKIWSKLHDLVNDYDGKPFVDHNSKFLIIASNKTKNVGYQIEFMSITNYVVVFEYSNRVFVKLNDGTTIARNLEDIRSNPDLLYPAHPAILRNQTHKVFVHHQMPKVAVHNGKVYSEMTHFLDAVATIDGSKFVYPNPIVDGTNLTWISQQFLGFVINRTYDITLNTVFMPSTGPQKLMTYKQGQGYCALVARNSEGYYLKATKFVFSKPFDKRTWIMIAVSIITCTLLWRLGHPSTSCWYIPFFFWAFYHGQSINFPTNRKVFIILLQILVFMLLVLGNAYQGVITSFMIAQDELQELKSFEEVLDKGLKVATGTYFHMLMLDNEKYRKAFNEGRIKVMPMFHYDQLYQEGYVVISEKYYIDNRFLDFFYTIDENMFSYYDRLQVMSLSKHLRRWQLLMDWSFQAGLPQAWETFENTKTLLRNDLKKDIFKFDSIFYVIIGGFLLSSFVLLCEIFWHEFVDPFLRMRETKINNLSVYEIQERKFAFLRKNSRIRKANLERPLKRIKRPKAAKPKVRRIQVQPINPEVVEVTKINSRRPNAANTTFRKNKVEPLS